VSDFVIETRELGKRYGERIVAVDRLAMRVRRGEVYGFLGPNGVRPISEQDPGPRPSAGASRDSAAVAKVLSSGATSGLSTDVGWRWVRATVCR